MKKFLLVVLTAMLFSGVSFAQESKQADSPFPLGYIEISTSNNSISTKIGQELSTWKETSEILIDNFKVSFVLPINRVAFIGSYERLTYEADILGLNGLKTTKASKLTFRIRFYFSNISSFGWLYWKDPYKERL